MNSLAKGKKQNFFMSPWKPAKNASELLFSVIIVITWLKYPHEKISTFFVPLPGKLKQNTQHWGQFVSKEVNY